MHKHLAETEAFATANKPPKKRLFPFQTTANATATAAPPISQLAPAVICGIAALLLLADPLPPVAVAGEDPVVDDPVAEAVVAVAVAPVEAATIEVAASAAQVFVTVTVMLVEKVYWLPIPCSEHTAIVESV